MTKIRVLHSYYGHIVEFTDQKGNEHEGDFSFSHPYGEDHKEWAIELARDFIRKRHPDCYDGIDWDTIEFLEVLDD